MDVNTLAAFDRLVTVALGDTGQSKRAANFILAWWNADNLGGFDLIDLVNVDTAIANDMTTVFAFLASCSEVEYPYEYRAQITKIIEMQRPH